MPQFTQQTTLIIEYKNNLLYSINMISLCRICLIKAFAKWHRHCDAAFQIDSSVQEIVAIQKVTECVLNLNEILTSLNKNIQESSLPMYCRGQEIQAEYQKGMKLEHPNYMISYKITITVGISVDLENNSGVSISKINNHLQHYLEYTEYVCPPNTTAT